MTTIFSLLCQVCGLSHRESADLFDVRIDTVKSWSAGRNGTPDAVLGELVNLADAIDAAADEAVREIEAQSGARGGEPEVIEIGLASDDHEAQSLGLPCVGAHRTLIALTVARGIAEGYAFDVVPRGSTSLTAGAADAHRK